MNDIYNLAQKKTMIWFSLYWFIHFDTSRDSIIEDYFNAELEAYKLYTFIFYVGNTI